MAEGSPVVQVRVPDAELLEWLDLWGEKRGISRSEAGRHIWEMVKRQHPDPTPPSERPNGHWDWVMDKRLPDASHAPTCTCLTCKPPKKAKD